MTTVLTVHRSWGEDNMAIIELENTDYTYYVPPVLPPATSSKPCAALSWLHPPLL